MRKSIRYSVVALFFLMTLFASVFLQPSALASVRMQDDFYAAVNAPWIEQTVLTGDRPSVSGFCELARSVNRQLRLDFDAMDTADDALGQFLVYYAMVSDYATRDDEGSGPLLPYIERIQALENLNQLDALLDQWVLDGMVLPFSLYVSPDMGNAQGHALYAAAPMLFLPEVGYYGDPAGQRLLAVFGEVGAALLELAGVPGAEKIVADAIAFDAMLVPYVKTAVERAAYAELYNPVPVATFVAYSGALDFERLTTQLLGVLPEQVVVVDIPYFEAFGTLVSEETFPLFRHWMLLRTVFNASGYLDQAFQSVAETYRMALTGQTRPTDPTEAAFLLSTGVFSGVVGDYYGRTYFGEDARDAVAAMADRLIETFRQRLMANDWLTPATVKAAIEKLDALVVRIGYPDTVDPIYNRFVVTPASDGGTLLGNTMAFARIVREENFARYTESVDRTIWSIAAHTVNAQYSPLTNAITFPAAILQAPFYCPAQSESQNYGGIGTVIAHEITHAFDANGAQFGPDGSLGHWWTDADHVAFAARIEMMTLLFDGMPHAGGFVNGRMLVSENIADAGGLASALAVVQSLPDRCLEAFFRNWAVIWRMKATPEYAALLLALDVHAPGRLRTNVQLGNLDAFYDVFEVTEDDGMYIPPERRVTIW